MCYNLIVRKGEIMNDLFIIKNYVDEREFRNYINTILLKKGYTRINIDDPRIANNDKLDDNDILARYGNVDYTVQVYLNTKITLNHIEETLKDMEKENVSAGIIITNDEVSNEIKETANKKLIQIWDKIELEKYMD